MKLNEWTAEYLKNNKELIEQENYYRLFKNFDDWYANDAPVNFDITVSNCMETDLTNVLANVLGIDYILSKMGVIPSYFFTYFAIPTPEICIPPNITYIEENAFLQCDVPKVSYYKETKLDPLAFNEYDGEVIELQ